MIPFNLFPKVFYEKLSAIIILAVLVAYKAFYCQLHHCTQFRGRLVYQYVVKCHCSTISEVVGRCQWKFLLPMYFLLLHRCVTSIFDQKILSQTTLSQKNRITVRTIKATDSMHSTVCPIDIGTSLTVQGVRVR